MAGKYWYMEFDYARWLSDARLSKCRAATRGIWMDWLCVMADLEHCGQLAGDLEWFAKVGRCRMDEAKSALHDLCETQAADVTFVSNAEITLTNRRMRREFEGRKSNRERQLRYRQKHGNGNITPIKDEGEVESVVVPRSEYSPEFELAWGAYGKKGAKGSAQRRYVEAVKRLKLRGIDDPHVWLLGRIRLYLEIHCDRERKFFKDFEGWLNNSVYDFDDRAERRKKPHAASASGSYALNATAAKLAAEAEHDAQVLRERQSRGAKSA